MNNRFEFDLEAFGGQPFFFEDEEEIKRRTLRRGARRKSAVALNSAAARKAAFRGKLPTKPRPRPDKKFPSRFPARPLPYPVWPGMPPESAKAQPDQEPRQNSAPSGAPSPPPERDQAREGGEYARWVQVSLNKALNLNLQTNGVIGAETRDAIRSFQQREGLPVTGVVGPDTEKALVAAARGAVSATNNGAPGDAGTSGSSANAATSDGPAEASAEGGDQEIPWLYSVLPGLMELEFEPRELPMEFEAEPFGEFESTGVCPPFLPVAMENPGGGRVKNKTAPRAGDIIRVKRAFGGTVPLHRLAAKALDAMQCAARAVGIKAPLLQPTSGFRDPALQARLWAVALKKYGSPEEARKWVAPPGGSAHQSGRAVDLYLGGKNSSANVANLRTLPAYRWLVANARRFGFYSYDREPWHWEYNPQAPRQSETFHEFQELEEEFEDEGIGPIHGEITSAAAPSLIGQEQTPPDRTLYVKIPLGAEGLAKPMTGIFIPQRFRPEPKVDLIIYLHGIKPKADLTINRYWDRSHFPTWPLREGLNRSGKNFILVAPTLSPRSQTQTGWLTQPGGLDNYVDQALAALAAHGPYQGWRPQLGNLILACHSGGGLPMRRLAMGKNRYASHIKECWGFDCLYFANDENLWAQWARSRPDARLFIHYQSSTRKRSEELKEKKIPNISVSRSVAKGHNWVPIHHWQERLATSLQTQAPGAAAQPSKEWGQEWEGEGITNWFSRWARPSPAPVQPFQSPASALRAKAVALANQELNRWGKGAIKESDPRLRPVIEEYWRSGPGYKPSEPNWWSAVPWSAAFISWLMRKAGAGANFKYSGSHAAYTAAAKQNRLANNNNLFKAYRITEVRPRVGDLVCKSRAGSGATYDNIASGMATHCDIVTAVEPNRLTTIGGNVSDSVKQTHVRTSANGYINQHGYFAVIKVGA